LALALWYLGTLAPQYLGTTAHKLNFHHMATRSIEHIIAPPSPHMVGDGFRVHNFIPGAVPFGMERMTPFIMLDYGSKHNFSPSKIPLGVGVHPHRGFETTIVQGTAV
jgi:redox-sensitive bicupin YhaK (pirin superfamily)